MDRCMGSNSITTYLAASFAGCFAFEGRLRLWHEQLDLITFLQGLRVNDVWNFELGIVHVQLDVDSGL